MITMNEITKTSAGWVSDMLKKHKNEIIRSMPAGDSDKYSQFVRTAINSIHKNPMLANCTPESLFLAIVQAISCGLEPAGMLQEAYLIPYNQKVKTNAGEYYEKQAKFMPSYRGMIKLARRSGVVTMVFATAVRENDIFKVNGGTTDRGIIHEPDYSETDNPIILYYACMKVYEDWDWEVMTVKEIEKIRNRSKGGSAWQTDHNEMAKKTVLKRLLKRAPMSYEAQKAVEYDNAVLNGTTLDTEIDVEYPELPDEIDSIKESIEQLEAKDDDNAEC